MIPLRIFFVKKKSHFFIKKNHFWILPKKEKCDNIKKIFDLGDSMAHKFKGKWITDDEFFDLSPRNVFHKQLEVVDLPCDEHRNRHILFRRSFQLSEVKNSVMYISADDYYKLYINGCFVAQGPTMSYHFQYNYNAIDVTDFLKSGENTIAVHTLYQGLINRVWQSGDNRHGLILDLVCDGETVVSSDESFKTAVHTAYSEIGTAGYDTQFLEEYNSGAREVGFEKPGFDDSYWQNAKIKENDDHALVLQKSSMLEFESIKPTEAYVTKNGMIYDFGAMYVGYLELTVTGRAGDKLIVRCAQELNDDGSLRFDLRANCRYEETFIIQDGTSVLDWFDYKAFRYAELVIPEGCVVKSVSLTARHYPFTLAAKLKPEFADNKDLVKIWELCVRSQKYGVQEIIQDCMEREKGFYLGDGCYTALANMILTGDDSMVRRLIDDAFSTSFITDTLVTCMNCSFMQEIAEFPLILVDTVLWHYRLTGDTDYLAINYEKAVMLLEAFRKKHEDGYLLRNLDKWCVVEWPDNFRHGYDVALVQGEVCKEAHISINAYYIEAIISVNKMAGILKNEKYRDEKPLLDTFKRVFYDENKKLFKDSEISSHISLVGNSFVYGFDLCDDEEFKESFISMFEKNGIDSLSLFCTFPCLKGFCRNGRYDLVRESLLNEGAWKRTLREGGTATFEGWGKETKWNTSLFHLTMSYAAVFMADIDTGKLFE